MPCTATLREDGTRVCAACGWFDGSGVAHADARAFKALTGAGL